MIDTFTVVLIKKKLGKHVRTGPTIFFLFPIIGQGSIIWGHPYYTKYFDSGEISDQTYPLGGVTPRLERGSSKLDGLCFSVNLPF